VHLDLAWVTEFGELLMVWVTFLGGACAAQRGAHMTITEFIDKLEAPRRRWADAGVQALCLFMLLVLVRYGWSLVGGNWGNQLTVLQWPMAIQYMGMAVGCSADGRVRGLGPVAGPSRRAARTTLPQRPLSPIHACPDPLRRLLPRRAGRRAAVVRHPHRPPWASSGGRTSGTRWRTVFLSFIGGVEPFILLAVPLFIFAGELLAQGGVGRAHRRVRTGALRLAAGRTGRGHGHELHDVRRRQRARRSPTRRRSDRWSSRRWWRAATRAASPPHCWRWPARWRC
jgi:hypothetical protein